MSEFGRHIRRYGAVAAACLGIAACGSTVSAEAPAHNNRPVMGYDISYPQCGAELPQARAFGIIGLNGSIAYTANPCFGHEFAWAKNSNDKTAQPKASVYVHPADPGTASPHWPKNGKTPYGTCHGSDSRACAYRYGQDLARDNLSRLAAAHVAGVKMFLDAETNYSWQTPPLNEAVMEGMTATFTANHDKVGIYSDAAQWQSIAGTLPKSSNLHALPVWVLGADTVAQAEAICSGPSFTAGPVELAQIPAPNGGFDQDVACSPAR